MPGIPSGPAMMEILASLLFYMWLVNCRGKEEARVSECIQVALGCPVAVI